MSSTRRPVLSCKVRTFDGNWDKLLNSLIDSAKNGTTKVKRRCTYTLVFKKVDTIRYVFFNLIPIRTYKKYSVWVENKDGSYGTLYSVDDIPTEGHLKFAASQATLEELYDLEQSVDGKQTYEQLYLGEK